MAIKFKEGVTGEAQKPLVDALAIASVVYSWFGAADLIVTAVRNGTHKPGSLHARGYAADCRTIDVKAELRPALHATIKAKLGPAYDVVLETDTTPGASAPHLHMEFDPEHNGGINLP